MLKYPYHHAEDANIVHAFLQRVYTEAARRYVYVYPPAVFCLALEECKTNTDIGASVLG
jgi:hypothetical protein